MSTVDLRPNADIRKTSQEALDKVNAAYIGQSAASIGYATKADLDADLTPADGVLAIVTNDATATNNGTYRKSGAAGTGSWVQSSYDRVALVEGDVNKLISVADNYNVLRASTGQDWLNSKFLDIENSDDKLIASAIYNIRCVDYTDTQKSATYWVSQVRKLESGYTTRVDITDGTDTWIHYTNYDIPTLDDSPFNAKTAVVNGMYFELTVDFKYLSAGFIRVVPQNVLTLGSRIFKPAPPVFLTPADKDELNTKIDNAVTELKNASTSFFDYTNAPATDASYDNFVALDKAVSKVVATGFSDAEAAGEIYIITITRNDPDYGDTFTVKIDATGNTLDLVGTFDDTTNGVSTFRVGGADKYLDITIDFSLIGEGVLINTAAHYYLFNKRMFEAYASVSDLNALDTRVTNLETTNDSYFIPDNVDTANAYYDNFLLIKAAISKIVSKGFTEAERSSELTMNIVTRNDSNYGDMFTVYMDGVDTFHLVGVFDDTNLGVSTFTVADSANIKSLEITIDFTNIPEGLLINTGSNLWTFNNKKIFENADITDAINSLDTRVTVIETSKGVEALPAIRVSVAGSSITWGSGWLGYDSYVGYIDKYLRNNLATTITDFQTAQNSSIINNNLFYGGKCTEISGANSEVTFSLYGDELSLCLAKTRDNVGASEVELYIDDVLYDTFVTNNKNSVSTQSKSFTGNGTAQKFDLGSAFTFNHAVTLDGTVLNVIMNTQGYGATMASGVDGLIIRSIIFTNGVPAVHHVLWLATPPADGASISVSFQAGNAVYYTKSTVGQLDLALDSTNESTYGDGATSFDPDNPANISSGLDFRESDEESVVSWKFTDLKHRTFKLKVKGLSSVGTGTPMLYLNFATNRMHHIQNAGIGGWTASKLLTNTALDNMESIYKFKPDIFMLESCTNDDWSTNEYKAYKSISGISEATLRDDDSAYFYSAITYNGTDYDVEDIRLTITAITRKSLTYDATNVTNNVAVGDVVVIGNFKGDNRRLATRVVSAYDTATNTIRWKEPLLDSDIIYIDTINDLVGDIFYIKGASQWVSTLNTIIDDVDSNMPLCEVVLGTSGIPNIRHRRLEGYKDLALGIVKSRDVWFNDFYAETLEWQYSQKRDTALFLSSSASVTSDGSSEYILYLSNGAKLADMLARNFSVKVNGVERINRDCYITGGFKSGWAASTSPLSLSNNEHVYQDYKLVFTNNVPASGETIEILYSSDKWANDDTHTNVLGDVLFGRVASNSVKSIAGFITSKK